MEFDRGDAERWFEVVIHQHMPMFTVSIVCILQRDVRREDEQTNCGRPCDTARRPFA